ncbi:TM2 domain-containing protein [Rhodovibrio salinarum]|uniref:TM2 domain-containing protein n=2 Tax=Rhodovibrio salinarum TaxID=1087 RepID=A0A934V205_9PROT|nr:TM2 domain-containing protein [Rhodovibrio salinarum]
MVYCNTCGKDMARLAESCPSCGAPNPLAKPKQSEKSMVPAALLCFFFGALGFHRFYVGKIITGILMILTFGGLGIWALIDFVMIIVGSFKDSEGLPLKR